MWHGLRAGWEIAQLVFEYHTWLEKKKYYDITFALRFYAEYCSSQLVEDSVMIDMLTQTGSRKRTSSLWKSAMGHMFIVLSSFQCFTPAVVPEYHPVHPAVLFHLLLQELSAFKKTGPNLHITSTDARIIGLHAASLTALNNITITVHILQPQ